MYSTTSQNSHHKSAEGNAGRFFLVRWYYSHYYFFGYCCVGAEFCYVTLYILRRISAAVENGEDVGDVVEMLQTFGQLFLYIAIPACATKQIVNVSQLCSSCYAVAEFDAKVKNEKRK